MNKKTLKIKDGEWIVLSRLLMDRLGLPEVSSTCALYFYHDKNVYGLNFINSRCFFDVNYTNPNCSKIIDEGFYKKVYPLEIENRNIKSFLKFFTNLGLERAFIGDELINITFITKNDGNLKIILDTPIGDLLVIRGGDVSLDFDQYIEKDLDREYIESFFSKNTVRENIFDNMGIMHPRITKYGDTHGISMKISGETNIKNILAAKSNDYDKYERIYKKLLGTDFNTETAGDSTRKYFEPLSIIIPAYKSEKTILKTLYSIESQNIPKEKKKLIDVIIIDDGNKDPLYPSLKKIIGKLSPSVRFIRLENNNGISNARNIGVQLSKYKHLLFLDSDIVLPSNYLYEHSICLQLFPNCLFVSMKKNISDDHPFLNEDSLLKGIPVPDSFDDKRFFRKDVYEKNAYDIEMESLSETNLYKNFGYGRVIAGHDLPSVVVGHNMSMNKRLFNKAGGFSTDFKGWGMEDTLFGAKFIAKGGFIVPLLKTGVYHIDHEPRSGSEERKKEELEKNLHIYKKYIENTNEQIY